MLRTNSKKARENVRAYIMGYRATLEDERGADYPTFKDMAAAILEEYHGAISPHDIRRCGTYQDAFVDWGRGLPCHGLFDIFTCYDGTPRAIVAGILEETPEQAARFSDDDAAVLLSKLIYMECLKATGATH